MRAARAHLAQRHARRERDLAAELLADYGTLSALAAARPEELAARTGVGPAKAAALVAAFQLGRRATGGREGALLRSSADVERIARHELSGARRERVLVLICDGANRLRRTVTVSEGSVDRSLVPVREILNAVLRHDGRAFALAHNHPSGNADPSNADRRATDEVKPPQRWLASVSSATSSSPTTTGSPSAEPRKRLIERRRSQ